METTENELQALIHEVYRSSDLKKIHQIIRLVYERVNLRKCFLKKIDMERLNKISLKSFSLETNFSIGVLYNIILSYQLISLETLDSNFLLTIVNILYPLYEKLKGTILDRRLIIHIRNILHLLNRRPELSKEDHNNIRALLESPDIKQHVTFAHFDDLTETIKAKECLPNSDIEDKSEGLMHIIKILEKCDSIEEQLAIFTKKLLPLFKLAVNDITEKNSDCLRLLAMIAEHILFETDYLIRLNEQVFDPRRNLKEDPGLFFDFTTNPTAREKEIITDDYFKPDDVKIMPYKLAELGLVLRINEDIYPVISFLINVFSCHKKIIPLQRIAISILQRFYYCFPRYRKNIEEALLKVFSNINEDTNNSNKREAAAFLYRLLHRDATPEFKELLKTRASLSSLYDTTYFAPEVLDKEKNIYESINIRDLHIRAGFPKEKEITAGQNYELFIEVWKPFSILYWHFSLLSHDINFVLTKVASFGKLIQGEVIEPITIYEGTKLDVTKNFAKGSLIVKESGIYKFEFDNTGSWFNSKTLKYSIHVLEPDFPVDDYLPEGISKPKEEKKLEEGMKRRKTEDLIEIKNPTAHGVLYLNEDDISFQLKSGEKSSGTTISHQNENTQWEQVNEKILETINKLSEVESTLNDTPIKITIVYNPIILEKIFSVKPEDAKNFNVTQEILNKLTFLSTLEKNISGQVRVISDTDYSFERIAELMESQQKNNIYFLAIDNYSKKVQSARKEKNEIKKAFDISKMCYTYQGPEGIELRKISNLYFSATSNDQKLAYLSSMIINAILHYQNELAVIHAYETKSTELFTEENKEALKNKVQEYLKPENVDFEVTMPELILGNVDISALIKGNN